MTIVSEEASPHRGGASQIVSPYYSSEASDSDTALSAPNRQKAPANVPQLANSADLRAKKSLPPFHSTVNTNLSKLVPADSGKEIAQLNSVGWKVSSVPADSASQQRDINSQGSKSTDLKKRPSTAQSESLSKIFARMWGSDKAMSCLVETDQIGESLEDLLSVPGKYGGMCSITHQIPRPFMKDFLSNEEIRSLVTSKGIDYAVLKLKNKTELRGSNVSPREHGGSVTLCSFGMNANKYQIPISIRIKPLNQGSNEPLNGALNPRSIGLILQWKENTTKSRSRGHQQQPFAVGQMGINLHFRTCVPVISVSPLNIDFGNCLVSAERETVVTVTNGSDLMTEIVLTSDDAKLTFIAGHNIPPRQSVDIVIQFRAPSKCGAYNSKIKVRCLHSPNSETIPISIIGQIISPPPITIDSKLIHFVMADALVQTEPQILNFGSSLVHLPNVRAFGVQNTHNEPLTLQISAPSNLNLKMYTVSPSLIASVTAGLLNIKPFPAQPSSTTTARSSVLSRIIVYLNIVPDVLIINDSGIVNKNFVTSDRKAKKEQHLEDLKWGGKSVKLRGSGDRKSLHRTNSLGANPLDGVLIPALTASPRGKLQQPSDDFLSTYTGDSKVKGGSFKDDFLIRDASRPTDDDDLIGNMSSGDERTDYSFVHFLTEGANLTPPAGVGFPFNLLEEIHEEEAQYLRNAVIDGKRIEKSGQVELPRKRRGSGNEEKKLKPSDAKIQRIANYFSKLSNSLGSPIESNSLQPVVFDKAENSDTIISQIITINAKESVVIAFALDPQSPSQSSEEVDKIDDVNDEWNRIEFVHNLSVRIRNITGDILNDRTISLRGQAICSEIVVIQRNISFGRTVLGDETKQSVTLVNKSSVPALFSISKSGKISSSFLTVPQGRTGTIGPFSSRSIDFIFKPTLAGSFVETLQINNPLNPSNLQTVTIKAKVSKMESFQLSPSSTTVNLKEDRKESEEDFPDQRAACQEALKNYFDSLQNNTTQTVEAPTSGGITTAVREFTKTAQENHLRLDLSVPYTSLGSIIVGEMCHTSLSFRIKNVTSKQRQFIIDATHTNAVKLVLPNICSEAVPFGADSDILSTVLCLKCRFETSTVKSKGEGDAALDEEKLKALQDSLEAFQQKLKIAIRKNKPEKIQKYQKKINEVIQLLAGKGDISTIEPTSTGDIPVESTLPVKENMKAIDALNESDVTCHFDLNPEEEKLVQVLVCFYPGSQYKHWSGPLPFVGYLRVFECKNEDFVKFVPFCALISLPDKPIDSSIISDESLNRNRYFIVTVPQYSSYPTRLFFQKYRQLPQAVLGVAIKLVQSSQERLMTGCFSIAYTHTDTDLVKDESQREDNDMGIFVHISVDNFLNSNFSLDSTPYSESLHGLLSFAVISGDYNNGDLLTAQQIKMSSNEGSIGCRIPQKEKLDFMLQWKPSHDLSALPKRDVRIVGALKFQFYSDRDAIPCSTQYVPFVSILEHKSTFKLNRYCNFEQIAVAQYRTCQVPIINTSPDSDLHYIFIGEEVSTQSRLLGKIEVINGQTGVIPPNGTKSVHLHFKAFNTRGKFEQKFWVRNVKDGFDQKRIIVQATIVPTPEMIVDFPDLELAPGALNKYVPIDMGYVYIQDRSSSINMESVKSYLRSEKTDIDGIFEDYVYPLRIQNLYTSPLVITAKSNLASQCFLFSDRECKQYADKVPLEVDSSTTLFIALRPAAQSKKDDVQVPTEDPTIPETPTTTRELVGGIKLVFNLASSTEESSDNSVTKTKILETMLSFKAIIGKSVLSLFGLPLIPMIQKVLLTDKTSPMRTYSGSFEIRNQSLVFNLRYCFIKNEKSPVSFLFSDDGQTILGDTNVATIAISDNVINVLSPNTARTVKYRFIVPNKQSLLHLYEFRILNIDTREEKVMEVDIFFDRQVLEFSISAPAPLESQQKVVIPINLQKVVESNAIVWLSRIGKATHSESTGVTSKPPIQDMCCINDETQFTFIIRNTDSKAVTISPVTNLPFSLVPGGSSTVTSLKNAAEELPQTLHLTTVRRGSASSSLLGAAREKMASAAEKEKPVGKYRGKLLYKCGESFTIEAKSSITIIVSTRAGLILRDRMLNEVLMRRGIQSGQICSFVGILAFLQAAHALQSVFEKPVANLNQTSAIAQQPIKAATSKLTSLFAPPISFSESSSSSPSLSADSGLMDLTAEVPSLENLPTLSLLEVRCSFVLPDFRIKHAFIDFNSYKAIIRRGDKISFDVPLVENLCEVDLPIRLENVPEWLSISLHHSNSKNDSFDASTFFAAKKGDSVFKFVARIPIGIEDGMNEAIIRVKPLHRLNGQSNDVRSFTIRLIVDPKSAVEMISDHVYPLHERTKFCLLLKETIITPTPLTAVRTEPLTILLKSHSDEVLTVDLKTISNLHTEDAVHLLAAVKLPGENIGHFSHSLSHELQSFASQSEMYLSALVKLDSPLYEFLTYEGVLPLSLQNRESSENCRLVQLGTVVIATSSQPAASSPSPSRSELHSLDTIDENISDSQSFIEISILANIKAGRIFKFTNTLSSEGIEKVYFIGNRATADASVIIDQRFVEYAIPLITVHSRKTVTIHNLTSRILKFRSRAISRRFPGLRIQISGLANAGSGYYDTIKCVSFPEEATILPLSSLDIHLTLLPGNVNESLNADSDSRKDLEELIVPIHFYDAADLLNCHPPSVISVVIHSADNIPLKTLKTQPLSGSNRSKQHLDHMLVEGELKRTISWDSRLFSSTINETSSNSESAERESNLDLTDVKAIRLRGATPLDGKKLFLADLGQQQRRDDAVEWMLTLENCSSSTDIHFSLECPDAEGTVGSWLHLGQSQGVIPPHDSVAVMIYVVRAVCGVYKSAIKIVNELDPSDSQTIFVSISVVAQK